MSSPHHPDEQTTRPVHTPSHPTTPIHPEAYPPEPEDVDALLAESLRAESERDFTWKEPTRKPRWWERAEVESPPAATPAESPRPSAPATAPTRSAASSGSGPRVGQMLWGAVCLVLALWVLAGVMLGVTIEPVLLALGLCTFAGIALVLAGLRPKRGRRL